MKIVGILCEYNPLHLGHAKQLSAIRGASAEETAIVCLMSGNFVQRGYPAVFDKALRARAALEAGADLVLELPVQYALSSAEGFAGGAVSILGAFCDEMSFGAEHPDPEGLMASVLNRWFEALCQTDWFLALASERWQTAVSPAVYETVIETVKKGYAMEEEAEKNYERWKIMGKKQLFEPIRVVLITSIFTNNWIAPLVPFAFLFFASSDLWEKFIAIFGTL